MLIARVGCRSRGCGEMTFSPQEVAASCMEEVAQEGRGSFWGQWMRGSFEPDVIMSVKPLEAGRCLETLAAWYGSSMQKNVFCIYM